jgi:hypothetical protein
MAARPVFHHELVDPNCLVAAYPGCGSHVYQYAG